VQERRVPGPRGGAFFYLPRGPALADADLEGWQEWLARTRALAEEERAVAVRVEPESRAVGALLSAAGYRPDGHVQPPRSRIIDLRPEPDQIRAQFKPKTRYNIGLAQRRGVVVDTSHDVDALEALARETARREAIHLPGRTYYASVLEALGPAARLYVAQAQNVPLAAILVATFGVTTYYLYGGSSRAGRSLMPNYLLHWVALTAARAGGCHFYDLWGTHEAGLEQFKAGFGGQTVEYLGAQTLVLRPWAWRRHRALTAGKRTLRLLLAR
jgi:lipid II:glycine glycyltransferase (peptidoglycan interpeptide bridge formation enzyme)